MNPSFLILTPPYSPKSAGIIALWNLAKTLLNNGENVKVCLFQPEKENLTISFDNKKWITCQETTLANLLDNKNFIVITPEIIAGKWLKNLLVARYYLNKVGVMGHGFDVGEDDYKISFHKIFCDSPDFYLPQYLGKINLDIAEKMKIKPRDLNLTYIGKGDKYIKETTVIPNSVLLSRIWPSETSQYVTLLSHTNLLFSYDPLSSTLMDAVLLGAVPVILNFKPFDSAEILSSEYCPPFFKIHKEELKINRNDFLEHRQKYIHKNKLLNNEFPEMVKNLCSSITDHFR